MFLKILRDERRQIEIVYFFAFSFLVFPILFWLESIRIWFEVYHYRWGERQTGKFFSPSTFWHKKQKLFHLNAECISIDAFFALLAMEQSIAKITLWVPRLELFFCNLFLSRMQMDTSEWMTKGSFISLFLIKIINSIRIKLARRYFRMREEKKWWVCFEMKLYEHLMCAT